MWTSGKRSKRQNTPPPLIVRSMVPQPSSEETNVLGAPAAKNGIAQKIVKSWVGSATLQRDFANPNHPHLKNLKRLLMKNPNLKKLTALTAANPRISNLITPQCQL